MTYHLGAHRRRTFSSRGTVRLALTLLALSVACTGTIPGRQHVGIRTDRDRYVLQPGRFGHETTILASFTAPPETTVYILHCNGAISWGIQRLVADRWTDEWIATTNACLSEPIVVEGGRVYADTLILVSRGGALVNPGGNDPKIQPGTYRVVWYNVLTSFDPEARPFGNELPLERRVSDAITIDSAPG